MPSLLNNFIVNYKAIFYKLAGRRETAYMPWPDVLKATNIFSRVAVDFFSRNSSGKISSIKDYDADTDEITIGDLKFFYPKKADKSILSRTYFEIFNPHNGHFYDIAPTLPTGGDVVYDIGACEGMYGMKHLRGIKKLYLFEPSPTMCKCLSLTFSQFNRESYRIMNALLSGVADKQMFFIENEDDPTLSRIAEAGEEGGKPIRQATIDSLVESGETEPPSLLKMDVQGAEPDILHGAENTIRKYKPRMAVTTYHNPPDASDILDFCLAVRPDYRYTLKGITTVEPIPRPTMVHLY